MPVYGIVQSTVTAILVPLSWFKLECVGSKSSWKGKSPELVGSIKNPWNPWNPWICLLLNMLNMLNILLFRLAFV